MVTIWLIRWKLITVLSQIRQSWQQNEGVWFPPPLSRQLDFLKRGGFDFSHQWERCIRYKIQALKLQRSGRRHTPSLLPLLCLRQQIIHLESFGWAWPRNGLRGQSVVRCHRFPSCLCAPGRWRNPSLPSRLSCCLHSSTTPQSQPLAQRHWIYYTVFMLRGRTEIRHSLMLNRWSHRPWGRSRLDVVLGDLLQRVTLVVRDGWTRWWWGIFPTLMILWFYEVFKLIYAKCFPPEAIFCVTHTDRQHLMQ